MKPNDIKCGMVLRHHSGRVYTVTGITNTAHDDPERKPEAVLLGANGNLWSRSLDTFGDDKFSVLYDGTNLADLPAKKVPEEDYSTRLTTWLQSRLPTRNVVVSFLSLGTIPRVEATQANIGKVAVMAAHGGAQTATQVIQERFLYPAEFALLEASRYDVEGKLCDYIRHTLQVAEKATDLPAVDLVVFVSHRGTLATMEMPRDPLTGGAGKKYCGYYSVLVLPAVK